MSPLGARNAYPLVAAVALFCAPNAVLAQGVTPGGSSSQQRLVSLFSGLSPNQDVQIVASTMFIEQGEFREVRPDVVEVSSAGETVPVDLNDIRSVSLRSGHGLKGALWGLGSGLLAGSVSGLMIASFDCRSPAGCDYQERQGAIRGGILMGVTGAITGYLLGRADAYWKPVFP